MKHALIIGGLLSVLLAGCMSASQHRQAVQDDTGERVTVGTVQKEIHVGMSGAEVATVLGSPNIVSTDEERREVWIYDKVATDYAYSSSSGGISALILGWGSQVAAAAAPSYSGSSGAASTTQRTLTIIIKFDKEGKVRDFAYHTSKF
jgi:outer membrane protein assembly factor BamE (lipoprotein component of BamABCDE complex)